MKGGTREYLDLFNWQVKNYEDILWINRKLSSWLNRSDSPKSIIFFDSETQSDPLKFEKDEKIPEQEIPTPRPPGTSERHPKPQVIRKPTPNQSSRNGVPIRRIVLHYTTSGNDQSTISWFATPASRVSSHYLVGKTGVIYQFVDDSNKAWHAYNANSDTIGIEHTARPGERLTSAQEKATIELIKFLLSEYKLTKSSITAHRFMPGQATSCPGDLWKTQAELTQWIDRNF